MPTIKIVNIDRRSTESTYLLKSSQDVHSQCGEDGIIERIFEIIEPQHKWCVEFGAWDGIRFSNTCHLVKAKDWTCVQIEGDHQKFLELERNFSAHKNSVRLNNIIGYTEGLDTIDDALKNTGIPYNFDLISIDIDGNDWFIWESMREHRPRIVIIEYNPTIPNDVIFIQDRDMHINEGCSLAALIELGKEKGYELICATPLNGIFVVKEEFHRFGIFDNSIDAMRTNSRGRMFMGYNGKIYHTMDKFYWRLKGVRSTPDMFQVLTEENMQFGDRISKSLTDK